MSKSTPEGEQMKNDDAPLLVTPGPVPLPHQVLQSLAEPVIHHRTPNFESVLRESLNELKKIFVTEQDCFILTSTGTGAMEAALVNLLSPGDEVIALIAGRFGERWAKMAEVFGARVYRVAAKPGQSIAPAQLAAELKLHPSAKLVLVQATETSTGALQPIKELAALTRQTPSLLVIDAITALGALPLNMDDWGLDVVIGGSQKAFMLPTGLSFISLSERAWDVCERASCPRFYFDLRKERAANKKNQTSFSSAVTLIRALNCALDLMLENGLTSFLEQIEKRALHFRKAIGSLGLEFLPTTPSPALTVIRLPVEIDGKKLRAHIEKNERVVMMGGQDELEGKVLRVGHMGAMSLDDLTAVAFAIGRALRDFGEPLGTDEQIRKAVSRKVT